MRTIAAALGIALGLCIMLLAPPAPERAAALASYHIGDSVALPELRDTAGHPVDLAKLQGNASAPTLVIEFWSARCPISGGYAERVAALAADFAAAPVEVLAITACGDESAAEIQARQRHLASPVPLLVDPAGRLAEQFGVAKTPHFVIIDRQGELVYSGAFDSNLIDTGAERHDYLRDALHAVLAGRPAPLARTRTFGSPVRRETHAASIH